MVLIETTILVDYLRRSAAAADYLDTARSQGNLICSAVTQAELIVGSRTRAELRAIDQLLTRFNIEPIDRNDSVRRMFKLGRLRHHIALNGQFFLPSDDFLAPLFTALHRRFVNK